MTGGLSYKREATLVEDFDRRSVGGYLQNQSSWGDRLFATAGLRYDNNDKFSSFLTGNFDLAFLATEELKIRTSVGNGFRAPEFAEIIGFPTFGISGNPSLDPERNLATEFGADFFSSGGKSRVSTTAFFNYFSDLIEFSFLVPPGTPNYQNIEKASSKGIEIEMLSNVQGNFWLGANYSYVKTRVENTGLVPGDNFVVGEQLLRRPTHSGTLNASYTSPTFRTRVDFNYIGEREDRQFFPGFTSSRVTLPGLWKVDLNLEVPFYRRSQRGQVSFTMRGKNLLDQEYVEIAGFQAPGRTLLGGIRLTF